MTTTMTTTPSRPLEGNALVRASLGWDVVNWRRALPFWQDRLPRALAGARALEVGAGKHNGGISLWLAAQGAEAVSSNLNPVDPHVRDVHEGSGYAARIRYEVLDALNLPYRDAFDVVTFKSVLGGIGAFGGWEAQVRAVQQMHHALKPGGVLLFAENLVATPVHSALRRRFGAGRDNWRYLTLEEMEACLAPFARREMTTTGFLAALGPGEALRSALGHADGLLTRVVPRRWHYIAIGVAWK